MKSILTLLAVVCVASLGFSGCASGTKKCCQQDKACPVAKVCPMTKVCPVTKKTCTNQSACCAKTPANCPTKKAAQ